MTWAWAWGNDAWAAGAWADGTWGNLESAVVGGAAARGTLRRRRPIRNLDDQDLLDILTMIAGRLL